MSIEILLHVVMGNNGIGALIDLKWNEYFVVRLKPSASVTHTGILYRIPSVRHSVNEFGYKGCPRKPLKDKNIYRIIIIGDSFTFCPGIEDKYDYPSRLEFYLSLKEKNIEVLNFGIPAHNLKDIYKHFKSTGLKFKPDMIIIQTAQNDFSPSLEKIFKNLKPSHSLFYGKLYSLRIFMILYLLYTQNVQLPAEKQTAFFDNFCFRLKKMAEKNSVKLLAVSFGDPLHSGKILQEYFFSKYKIPYFSLPDRIKHYLNYDMFHLNKTGADLYAQELSKWIIQNKFINKALKN